MCIRDSLSHAGILVLLLISQKQEKALEADKVEFTKDWNKNGRDVDLSLIHI